MADEAVEAGEETPEKKKGGIVPLLLVAVIAAAAGGGGAYIALGAQAATAPAAGAVADGTATDGEDQGPPPAQNLPDDDGEDLSRRLVELAPFVVNITDEGLRRYLKVKIDLELTDAEQRPLVEASKARIRDAVIVLLSAKRMADLSQFEGKLLLKDELRDRVNALFGGHVVQTVLFTEFVVQ